MLLQLANPVANLYSIVDFDKLLLFAFKTLFSIVFSPRFIGRFTGLQNEALA